VTSSPNASSAVHCVDAGHPTATNVEGLTVAAAPLWGDCGRKSQLRIEDKLKTTVRVMSPAHQACRLRCRDRPAAPCLDLGRELRQVRFDLVCVRAPWDAAGAIKRAGVAVGELVPGPAVVPDPPGATAAGSLGEPAPETAIAAAPDAGAGATTRGFSVAAGTAASARRTPAGRLACIRSV
jgi:hypothetical protein